MVQYSVARFNFVLSNCQPPNEAAVVRTAVLGLFALPVHRYNKMIIRPPEPQELETVFQLAFRHLEPDEQAVRIQTLLKSFQSGAITADGVFLAEEHGQLAGVLYAQRRPDGSVLLFPPVAVQDDPQVLRRLFESLDSFCCKNKAAAAVALADAHQPFDEKLFQSVGKFEFLSEMVCLVSTLVPMPKAAADTAEELTFVPMSGVAEQPFERMCAVVQQTYKKSKDFPRLMSLLPVADVLRGYQGDDFLPELWFFIQRDGQDVGSLLLTDMRDGTAELTYIGLTDAVRGRGWSLEIIRFAQRTAFYRNALYLMTSADEQNTAALKAYLSCDFRVWDRKRVFVRLFAR